MKEEFIKTIFGQERIFINSDATITYPDHDPCCIIYKIGPEHCNCSLEYDDEFDE